MSTLDDPRVVALLTAPNHAVVSTANANGSILSNVVWISLEQGVLAVNSAEGRRWPRNLKRDPRLTVVVFNERRPYEYVEIRGTASSEREGAYAHIESLSKKYMDLDYYPYDTPGQVRIKHVIRPDRVRYYVSD